MLPPGGSTRFICFEGLDGCGKSTQARLLAEKLSARNQTFTCVRDPGGTPLSERIRELILSPDLGAMHARTELLLYAAARSQLVRDIIEPALARGETVIADRFGWSSLAYQGYGRGLDGNLISTLIEIACGEIFPSLTFLLDMPVDAMRARLDATGKRRDRIESEDIAFFERVRQGYLELAIRFPDRLMILDARQPPEVLHACILERTVDCWI